MFLTAGWMGPLPPHPPALMPMTVRRFYEGGRGFITRVIRSLPSTFVVVVIVVVVVKNQ